jgi:hypothetical protein
VNSASGNTARAMLKVFQHFVSLLWAIHRSSEHRGHVTSDFDSNHAVVVFRFRWAGGQFLYGPLILMCASEIQPIAFSLGGTSPHARAICDLPPPPHITNS